MLKFGLYRVIVISLTHSNDAHNEYNQILINIEIWLRMQTWALSFVERLACFQILTI